jgi:cyclohexadienyl dehydratase
MQQTSTRVLARIGKPTEPLLRSAYVLLATIVGPAHAETTTHLDAIVGSGALRVGIDVDMAMSLAHFDIAMGGVTITLDRQKIGLFSDPVFSSGKTPITHCGDEPKYETIAAIDQPGVHVIVHPGGTNERFDRTHLPKATIIQWNDNATIFDALVEGKGDLMITDAVETRVQAKLHPGILCSVHPNAPFDHSELAYWMPRDPIFSAYVNQWLNLLDLSGEHQAILARWMP